MRSLVAAIFNTQDVEIDCRRFMEVVATYVDAEVSGLEATAAEASVPQHAQMCPECAELYSALHHVAALEADGSLPAADELWAELEAMVGTSGDDGAASAPEGRPRSATQDAGEGDRRAAFPDPPAASAARRKAGTGRRWLADWRHAVGGRSMGLGPGRAAAIVAIMVVLAVGWAQSRREAAELRQALDQIGRTQLTRIARNDEGAWLRVDYAPEKAEFVVWTGDLHEKSGVERFRCWLIGKDGSRTIVGNIDMADHDSSWWMMEADGPMGDYEAVVITREPDGEEILRAALGP